MKHIQALCRSPLKTALTLLLLAAAVFLFLYNLSDYSVSHREYGTGYFFSSPSEDAQIVSDNLYLNDRAFLAVVHSFDPETGLAFCEQYNKMRVGDEVNLLSPGTTGRNLTVTALLDADMQPIPDTRHPRMRFYLPVGHAAPGDIIRGV